MWHGFLYYEHCYGSQCPNIQVFNIVAYYSRKLNYIIQLNPQLSLAALPIVL